MRFNKKIADKRYMLRRDFNKKTADKRYVFARDLKKTADKRYMLPRDFNKKLPMKGTYRNARITLVGLSFCADAVDELFLSGQPSHIYSFSSN